MALDQPLDALGQCGIEVAVALQPVPRTPATGRGKS
jgi:hypothetical protein